MDGTWQELFDLLEKLGKTLEQLTEISHEKTKAVMRDDLMAVNECMKKEQAISLGLRTTDIKRTKLLEKLGIGAFPLSALPEHCPEELRLKARQVAEYVRDQYMIYHSAAEVSRTTLEVNLHQIEKLIESEGGEPSPGGGMADIRA